MKIGSGSDESTPATDHALRGTSTAGHELTLSEALLARNGAGILDSWFSAADGDEEYRQLTQASQRIKRIPPSMKGRAGECQSSQ